MPVGIEDIRAQHAHCYKSTAISHHFTELRYWEQATVGRWLTERQGSKRVSHWMKMEYTILILLLTLWGARQSTANSISCPEQLCQNGLWDPIQCKCVDFDICTMQCEAPKFLDPLACECKCPNCPTSRHMLNPTTCDCSCPPPYYCPHPKVYNYNTCTCECPNTCSFPKSLDHSTCECVCIEYLCPFGKKFDRGTCSCICPVHVFCPGSVNLITCECIEPWKWPSNNYRTGHCTRTRFINSLVEYKSLKKTLLYH